MAVHPRMHIAVVAPLIGKTATGLSTYVADLVPRLCDAGHSVTLIATDCGYRGSDAGELVEIDSRAQFKLFHVPGRWNRRLYRSPEMVKWFRESVTEFDVVDIQGIWSWIAADVAAACRAAGVGYVLTPHGMMTRWDWQKQMLMKRVFFATKLRQVWRNASIVRYLSAGELQHSMVRPSSDFVVIPNAIEPAASFDCAAGDAATREWLALSAEDPVILFLGRVTDQKGVLELLRAFELLQAEFPRMQLVIAGPLEGAYGAAVRQHAEASGRGSIHVVGPVFGEAKQGLFAAATLFVTLSKNEGLSIAALEALSMGVPVVVTRDSNLPEAEAGAAGLTTMCDPVTAAKDIASILNDPARFSGMRRNARMVAEQHFSWSAVLPRLLRVYEQVAAGRVSRPTAMALVEG